LIALTPTPAEHFTFRALIAAARRAGANKRRSPGVARFRLALDENLLRLQAELLADRWWPGLPRTMLVYDPKPRTITVMPFRDRVVHQCLAPRLEAAIERRMIADSYACRRGLGTHAALRRATAWARTYRFALHLDVVKFFPSIDRAIVREHLARDIPLPWLHALCDRILDVDAGESTHWHFPGDDLFSPGQRRTGLPLGNLTSQLWANRYLDPIDHLVKDRLRHRAYLRYMDDMLLFHDDRAALQRLGRTIEEACWSLRLRLHPWEVRPTHGGVSFVGYRVRDDHVRVRRSTVARAEGRFAEMLRQVEGGSMPASALYESLRSTFGHWSHADTWRLKTRTLRRLGLLYDPDERW